MFGQRGRGLERLAGYGRAKRQRESNGGYGLGCSVQLATDVEEKIAVGLELTATASDGPQLEATLADLKQRLGCEPRQTLSDEG